MFVATPVQFGDDPVFALHREASARRARGSRCIDATLGVLMNDSGALAVLPSVAEVMRTTSPIDWAPYAGASGTDEFLSAVIDDCLRACPALREHALAIATPGATGALRSALTAFLARDQACLTSSYHWGTYSIIAQAAQRQIETFQLFDEQLRRFNVEDLERKLSALLAEQGRALVVINDPCHNPTGYTMTRCDWAAVAQVLDRLSAVGPITVVLDAVYAAFSPIGNRYALEALEPLIDKLLLVLAWSASKSFTCYGLRVGALIAVRRDAAERQHIRSTLAGHACGTWANCNRGGLAAIARLLTDPELRELVQGDREREIELLRLRSELFRAAAKKVRLVCPPYGGGFFTSVFVDHPEQVAARLRTYGIYVVPMASSLRIALSAVPTDSVTELALELRAAIDSIGDGVQPLKTIEPPPYDDVESPAA